MRPWSSRIARILLNNESGFRTDNVNEEWLDNQFVNLADAVDIEAAEKWCEEQHQ